MYYSLYRTLTDNNNHIGVRISICQDVLKCGYGDEEVVRRILGELEDISSSYIVKGYMDQEMLNRRWKCMDQLFEEIPEHIAENIRLCL